MPPVTTLACALMAPGTVAAAPDAPDWPGVRPGKLLSVTRIGIAMLHPGANACGATHAETGESWSRDPGPNATVVDPKGDRSPQFNPGKDMVSRNMDATVVWPTSQNAQSAQCAAIRAASRSGKREAYRRSRNGPPGYPGADRKCGPPVKTCENSFKHVMMFLENPRKSVENGRNEHRQTVLELACADALASDRATGVERQVAAFQSVGDTCRGDLRMARWGGFEPPTP